MKPFAHNDSLSMEQKTYNYRICRARIVVENAFGRLKANGGGYLKGSMLILRRYLPL